jgi:hypothetical protein
LNQSENKLKVMGGLSNLLNWHAKESGVTLTLSAENIYDGDKTLILGFVWMLILKYQVGKKAEIIEWLRELLELPIKNFDSDWKDGILFAKLVTILSKSDEKINTGTDDTAVLERLRFAFSTADTSLGIKELLSPEDVLSGLLDERSCLTYLSFFFNVSTSFFSHKAECSMINVNA